MTIAGIVALVGLILIGLVIWGFVALAKRD